MRVVDASSLSRSILMAATPIVAAAGPLVDRYRLLCSGTASSQTITCDLPCFGGRVFSGYGGSAYDT
jgi:hypothetical protein